MEPKTFGPNSNFESTTFMQPISEKFKANESKNLEKNKDFEPEERTPVLNKTDDAGNESGKRNARKYALLKTESVTIVSPKTKPLPVYYSQYDTTKLGSSTNSLLKQEYQKFLHPDVKTPTLISSTLNSIKFKSAILNSETKETYNDLSEKPNLQPKHNKEQAIHQNRHLLPVKPSEPSKPYPPSTPWPPCKPCLTYQPSPPRKPSPSCKCPPCKPCLPCKPPIPAPKPQPPSPPPMKCPCCKQVCKPCEQSGFKLPSKPSADLSDPITKVGNLLKKIFETTTSKGETLDDCLACKKCHDCGKCLKCKDCKNSLLCICQYKPNKKHKSMIIEPLNNDIDTIMHNITTSMLNNDDIYSVTTNKDSRNLLHLQDFSKQNISIEDETNPFQKERKALEARFKEIEDTLKPRLQQVKTTLGVNRLIKRNVQDVVYTAKDVAALEVIVDLIQHSRGIAQVTSPVTPLLNKDKKPNSKGALPSSTNSIQVHINIPYLEHLKRSANKPIKIRRVFAARMSSPVDMEYKVQSFQVDNPQNSITHRPFEPEVPQTCTALEGAQPAAGVLFLMDPNNPRSFIPIKSLKNIIIRQTNKSLPNDCTSSLGINPTQKMETTSVKNMGRVTLSKDFIVSLNEELIKLYNKVNIANNNNSVEHNIKSRDANKAETREVPTKVQKRSELHKSWERFKNLFQRQRICNCKCKPNAAMCSACAASDAVMNELLFEIDNLFKYMTAHCTEIQTYFYMNPTGGRKLKDAVHKIDVSLYNYYKRVKGHCQGKICTALSYVEKRSNSQPFNESGYIKNHLLDDLESVAYSINSAAKLNMCASDSLKEHVEKLIGVVRNCSYDKKMKRNEQSTIKPIKNVNNSDKKTKRNEQSAVGAVESVYTLDNINVNIICRPDTTNGLTRSPDLNVKSSIGYIVTDPIMANMFNYDDDEVKNKKKYKGLKKLLSMSRKSMKLNGDKTILRKLASFAENQFKLPNHGGLSCYYLNPAPAGALYNISAGDGTPSNVSPAQSLKGNKIVPSVAADPKVQLVTDNAGKASRAVRSYNVSDNTIIPDLLTIDVNKLFDNLPSVPEIMNYKHPFNTDIEITTLYPLTSTSKTKRSNLRKTSITKSQGITVTTYTEKKNISKNKLNTEPIDSFAPSTMPKEMEIFSEELTAPKSRTAILYPHSIISNLKTRLHKIRFNTATIRNWLHSKQIKYMPKWETESTGSEIPDLTDVIYLTDPIIERKGRALLKNNLEVLFDEAKDVLSQRTTTFYPTIFIIDDYDNEGVNDIIEQVTEEIDKAITKQIYQKERIKKEELLLDVLKFEKRQISNEMKKVLSKHDITSTSEDAMDDISRYFFNSPIPIKPIS